MPTKTCDVTRSVRVTMLTLSRLFLQISYMLL